MIKTKTLLYIDDESEQWIDILSSAAEFYDFAIIESDSIKDGWKQLDNYNAVIDCVLLDLKFPKEKMHGKDMLIELKKKYPSMPVIILTSSDTANDIKMAVECVKNGAFDYFGKSRLDIQQLFIQINNAIDSNIREEIHNNLLKSINESVEPHIFTTAFDYDGSKLYYGNFIYRLDSIILPKDVIEEKIVNNKLLNWHYDILSLASLLNLNFSIKLRYCYLPKTHKINIYFIFSVEGESKIDAEQKAQNLYSEINLYFSKLYSSNKQAYNFSLISDKKIIESIIKPFDGSVSAKLFLRRNKGINSDEIYNSALKDIGETERKIIDSIVDSRKTLPNLQNFLDQLVGQKSEIYFDILISPRKLSVDEIKNLKIINKGLYEKRLEVDIEPIYRELNFFINRPNQLFDIFVLLYSPDKKIADNILTAIVRDFFGEISDVRFSRIKINPSLYHIKFLKEYDEGLRQIGNIYSFRNAAEVFRLPFSVEKGFLGIEPSYPTYDNYPAKLSNVGPVLGIKRLNDKAKVIRLNPDDLRRHVYILGQTGTGKTTMLYSMIMERIYSGEGVALIDPHGDLLGEVIRSIPVSREKDIILFDPILNRDKLALNLLEYDKSFPEHKTFIINEIIKILDDIYDLKQVGGPMFEQYFRNALLLTMDCYEDKNTIKDAVKIFEDRDFRENMLEKCKDEDVVSFWKRTALTAGGEASLNNLSPYITSKLSRFINNHYLEPIISKRESSINFREIMDNKKILLIKLSKGKLGDDGVVFLGKILLNKIIMAAYSRENIPEKMRIDFSLFIDEFQNFISRDIESAMSEARKYHLNLIFANQTLAQVDDKILKTVLGNVGSLIFFRPGILDAEKIDDFIKPVFSKEEILKLPNYICLAKLQISNAPTFPFIFETILNNSLMKIINIKK